MASRPDDQFDPLSTWAFRYREIGWQAVPASSPSPTKPWKRPLVPWKGLEHELIGADAFNLWFGARGDYANHDNIGTITGLASGNLLVVDLDVYHPAKGKLAQAWIDSVWARLGGLLMCPQQITGGGGFQLFFIAPDEWTPPTFKSDIGVDIRGQGGFAILPPSMHSSGRQYRWLADLSPWDVPPPKAPQELIDAIEELRVEHGGGTPRDQPTTRTPTPGQDHNDFGRRVDGREDAMLRLVWAVMLDLRRQYPASTPPPVALMIPEFNRAWEKFERENKSRLPPDGRTNGELLEAEDRGLTMFQAKWNRALEQWNDKLKVEAGETPPARPGEDEPGEDGVAPFDPWRRATPPAFPLDSLSQVLRGTADHLSDSLGVDRSAAALGALVVAAGAIDQQSRLMRRKGWEIPPLLWGLLIGDPGAKKSPLMAALLRPLEDIETAGAQAYRRAMAQWKANGKEKGDEPERQTRYLFRDSTTEKLAEVLSRQDRGAMMIQDELAGWLGSMDRYGSGKGGADYSFFLTAKEARPYTVDRVGRGEMSIANLAVAVFAGTQFEAVRRHALDMTTDGMLQRFLVVQMNPAHEGQELDDQPAHDWATLINYLSGMAKRRYMLSRQARDVLDQFELDLLPLADGAPLITPGLAGFISKLNGTAGAVALVLHITADPKDAPYSEVSEVSASSAVKICHWLLFQTRSFYERLNAEDMDLQGLASFILTCGLDRLTPGLLRANLGALRGADLTELRKAMAPFVGGWVEEDWGPHGVKAWVVLPGVRDALAHRVEAEIQRRESALKAWREWEAEHAE